MSILDRLIQPETRASFSVANPKDPILAEWFGGRSNTSAGVSVTPDSAMRISAVFACVRILSSAIASLPLIVYRRLPNDGRQRDPSHSLYSLLHDAPNRWQTSYEFREMQAAHLLLRGNAYAEIVGSGTRAVAELIPLNPDRVRPFPAPDGTVAYEYTPEEGDSRIILPGEMHHLRGLGFDGLKGMSPIEYQREAVGLTLAAEQFGSAFFGNGTTLGGVLEHPDKLSDEAYDRLKRSWAERHQGVQDAHKPAILEEGMKWTALGVAPDQAQFLETRKFQISEIARIFGVPPHMLADIEKSTSWGSGIEQQSIGFVVYSLQPWLVRWEQAIKRDLFNPVSRRTHFAEFSVEGLLRGDSKARAEYYGLGIKDGWLTRNEARAKENMNAIDGLDDPLQPLNMVAVGEEQPQDNGNRALEHVHQDQFARAMDRIVTAETKALRRALSASDDLEDFNQRAAAFYKRHAGFVERHLDGLAGDAQELRRQIISAGAAELQEAIDSGMGGIRELLDAWDASRAMELTYTHAEKALQEVTHGH